MTDSADDILIHYGKKGMRWGHRQSRPSGDEIRTARVNVNKQALDMGEKRRAARREATSKEERKKANKDMREEFKALRKSDEFKTANRQTKGEMATNAVLIAAGTVMVASMFANLAG